MGKTESQRHSSPQANRHPVQHFGLVKQVWGRYPPGPVFGYPRSIGQISPHVFPKRLVELAKDRVNSIAYSL